MADDSTDVILRALVDTAEREHWTPAERLQAAALVASDRPVGKPAWRSASFWVLVLGLAASATVAVTGAMTGNATAAAVGAVAAGLAGAVQVVRNSGDKRADGSCAARKLEAVMQACAAPPVPAGAALDCGTCNGSGKLPVPNDAGRVTGYRPCDDCRGTGRGGA